MPVCLADVAVILIFCQLAFDDATLLALRGVFFCVEFIRLRHADTIMLFRRFDSSRRRAAAVIDGCSSYASVMLIAASAMIRSLRYDDIGFFSGADVLPPPTPR